MSKIAFSRTGFWVVVAMAVSFSTTIDAEVAQHQAGADPSAVAAAPAASPQHLPKDEPSSQFPARHGAPTDQFDDATWPNTANALTKPGATQRNRSAAPSTIATRRTADVTHDFATRPAATYFRSWSGIW